MTASLEDRLTRDLLGKWHDLIATLLIAAFLGSSIAALRFLWSDLAQRDFVEFHEMATNWVAGRSLYFHVDPTRSSNLNLPHLLPVVLPLAWFHLRPALLFWMGLNALALAISIDVIRRECPGVALAPLVLVALASGATSAQLATGQIAWVLTLPSTLAWRSARRDRWHAMAVWMAICISLKPFLAVFLPYLVLRHRWSAFISCLAVTSL
ncbi:MAG TPA: glycosyltransferase family 87 protein, partial [Vicinamibacterales bacterium]|nr:glycosyltransferase family 87 protein [Vicinamibacterales bacterium]